MAAPSQQQLTALQVPVLRRLMVEPKPLMAASRDQESREAFAVAAREERVEPGRPAGTSKREVQSYKAYELIHTSQALQLHFQTIDLNEVLTLQLLQIRSADHRFFFMDTEPSHP